MENMNEVWKNVSDSMVCIKVKNDDNKWIGKMVRGGKTLEITEEEREKNENIIIDDQYNPFTNGLLLPIQVADSGKEIASNPNHVTVEELSDVFDQKWTDFETQVKSITSPATIRVMYELAKSEHTNATEDQFNAVKNRLGEVDPAFAKVTEVRNVKVKKPIADKVVSSFEKENAEADDEEENAIADLIAKKTQPKKRGPGRPKKTVS